ncbi:MAG: class I SAM-dependent methyltransferase [Anaerolineaceae bacterium]
MHERRFNRAIEKLREPERLARMEVKRVVELALADLVEPQSMLDIGTGSGVFAEAFAAKLLRVAGVDASAEMLPVAQRYVPQGTFKLGTAEELPYDEGEFDLAFMGLLLHETDDPAKAAQEAFRVCKMRLAVLEWPYVKQEFGPGFNERIPTAKIKELGIQAGFRQMIEHRLKNFVLYCFDR